MLTEVPADCPSHLDPVPRGGRSGSSKPCRPLALPDNVAGNEAGGVISSAFTLDREGQLGLKSPSWDYSSGFPQPPIPYC